MMSFVFLFIVSILFPAMQTRKFTKCEMFQELKDLAGHGGVRTPEWVCLAFHMGAFDTQTKVENNGSTEYGLFQISNKFWCKSSQIPQSRNICGISCDKFLDDDITDDLMCVKKIVDIKGIDYWLAHKPLCSDKLEQWYCKS